MAAPSSPPRSTSTATSAAATCRRSSSTSTASSTRRIENVVEPSEIQHPAVRAVLAEHGLHEGPRDPSRRRPAGALGPRLEFVVHGRPAERAEGARGPLHLAARSSRAHAIHIEQDVIRENVGSQDQISAAYGGFNRIEFPRGGGFRVVPGHPPRGAALDALQGSPDAVLHRVLAVRVRGREVDKIDNIEQRAGRADAHAGDGRRGASLLLQGERLRSRSSASCCMRAGGSRGACRTRSPRPRSTSSTTRRAAPARSAASCSARAAAASCSFSSGRRIKSRVREASAAPRPRPVPVRELGQPRRALPTERSALSRPNSAGSPLRRGRFAGAATEPRPE